MENKIITPIQNNPIPPSPEPSPPVTPPIPPNPPEPPVITPIPPSQDIKPGPNINFSSSSGKSGSLSLILSALAVGIFILLVFVTGLIDSLTKAYIWFFVILALGVAGLITGLTSEKGRDRLSLTGLLGIILSVIVCVNCLVVGSYYIKIQIELNKFKTKFDTPSSSQNLDYNLNTN